MASMRQQTLQHFERDEEVCRFINRRLRSSTIDEALEAVRATFGEDRTPKRSAVGRYLRKMKVRAAPAALLPAGLLLTGSDIEAERAAALGDLARRDLAAGGWQFLVVLARLMEDAGQVLQPAQADRGGHLAAPSDIE
jgi:hypothetical protein